MASTYSPVPYCNGIKVHFWTNFPPISLDHYPLLQEFDLKKPSSSLKDLDKFLKSIPAISFHLTVRYEKIASEHGTRPQRTTDRKQRGKINSFCSSWENTLSVTPQGSIHGPLLFKMYVHDIFLILKTTYFTGYADGSMPFVIGDDTADALKALEQIDKNLREQFSNNRMKLNSGDVSVYILPLNS